AAVAVYLLALLPTSGLVYAGVQVAADRYTYLPALAWAPLVAALVGRDRARLAAGALAVVVLVPPTVRQIGTWRDSITLWEHGFALAPESPIARQQLA